MRRLLGAVGVAVLLVPASVWAGELAGRVSLGVEGTRLADLGPVVVFLEPEGEVSLPPVSPSNPRIRQRKARFDPPFLVITAGQKVDMPNDDTIFHNVFSFSRPNDFDLGVYPSGDSRTVAFEHAGLVKLYCSIHESMSGAVLVSPSPWFATASRAGEYRITGVPAGQYRLTVWNEKLPAATRSVAVRAQGRQRTDVTLGVTLP